MAVFNRCRNVSAVFLFVCYPATKNATDISEPVENGPRRNAVNLRNAFVNVRTVCMYRVTPRVFCWGTLQLQQRNEHSSDNRQLLQCLSLVVIIQSGQLPLLYSQSKKHRLSHYPVSYTHLTLPTRSTV